MANLMPAATTVSAPADGDLQRIRESMGRAVILVDDKHSGKFDRFNIKLRPLAKMRVYDIEVDAITIYRREEEIREDGIDDIFLTTLIEGQARVQQGSAKFTLNPGELAVMTEGTPYYISYEKPSRRLILQMPKDLFYDRIMGGIHAEFEARALLDSGLVPIVANLFQSLASKTETLSETDQHTLAESLLELSGAVIRSTAKHDAKAQNKSQEALMRRIQTYLDQHYSDCDLTPEKVAAANGISMRYLHRLFQKSGMAVSKSIWERRLKATREDLLNPSKATMRIGEIAYERGFNDTAHFSRSFHERFGIAPSKLRKKSLEQNAAAN